MYDSDLPMIAEGVFETALCSIITIAKHWEALERLAASQNSLQGLEPEVSRLQNNNTVSKSWNEVIAHLQSKLADAHAQSERDVLMWQALDDAELDTLLVVVHESTGVQLLPDAEQKASKCRA